MGLSNNADRWVPRLTGDGEPGNPAIVPGRRWSALSQRNRGRGEKITRGLDGGGFIEGTKVPPSAISPDPPEAKKGSELFVCEEIVQTISLSARRGRIPTFPLIVMVAH